MPWFRLDDNFDTHPKVITAGNEAIGLYIRCGAYAARHLTDGFVPRDTALLYGSAALVETLVRTKLWRRVRGGWMMHDYLDYNPSKEAVEKERKASAERQRQLRARRKSDTAETQQRHANDSRNGAVENMVPAQSSTSAAIASRRDSRRDTAVTTPAPTRTSYRSTNGRARGTAAAARAPAEKPPWCGECDERTRLVGDPPERCELCHPLVRTP